MNNEMLAIQIEGLLFALGRPLSYAELAKMLEVEVNQIAQTVFYIQNRNVQSGVKVIDDGRVVELRAAPQAAEIIEKVRKDEYSREIGKAGLEALAAIIYRGPLSRSEVDFIRGVNSSQTIRTLLMRGLVRKIPHPRDERSFMYEATTELLAQLGAVHPRDLPEFDVVKEKLNALEASYRGAGSPAEDITSNE